MKNLSNVLELFGALLILGALTALFGWAVAALVTGVGLVAGGYLLDTDDDDDAEANT